MGLVENLLTKVPHFNCKTCSELPCRHVILLKTPRSFLSTIKLRTVWTCMYPTSDSGHLVVYRIVVPTDTSFSGWPSELFFVCVFFRLLLLLALRASLRLRLH